MAIVLPWYELPLRPPHDRIVAAKIRDQASIDQYLTPSFIGNLFNEDTIKPKATVVLFYSFPTKQRQLGTAWSLAEFLNRSHTPVIGEEKEREVRLFGIMYKIW